MEGWVRKGRKGGEGVVGVRGVRKGGGESEWRGG